VAKDPAAIPDGEQLWVRNLDDEVTPNPWVIKILEELPDDAFNPKRRPVKKKISYR
jgi:hypothetical protein